MVVLPTGSAQPQGIPMGQMLVFLQSDCEGMGPRVEPSLFSLNRIRSICKQESSMKVGPISPIRNPICGPIQRRSNPPKQQLDVQG